MKNTLLTACLSILVLASNCNNGTEQVISGAIAFTLGNDTTMVQEFELKGNELKQVWIQRSPEVQIVEGTSILSSEGSLLSLKADYYKPGLDGSKTLLFTNELKYERDSTFVTLGHLEEPVTIGIGSNVMTTNLLKPIGMFWHGQMAYFAPESIGETNINAHVVRSYPNDFRLTRTSQNTVTVGSDAMGSYKLILDEKGRVAEIDGTASSFNFKGKVVAEVDMEKITRDFLQYENANGPWRSLTGKGEMKASIGGTSLSITYGRPFQRGRKIFGGIVPWNKVWRTGANAATKLVTDGQLRIGETALAAGEYSLWTIPKEDGNWQLVINSEANTWGTNHDATYDLHTIPLTVNSTESSTEQFTISVEAGLLKLSWANTEAQVAIQ